jgi:ACS family pantothenate transporter-like MFS transporter
MPICVAGFFFIPDVPTNINPRLKWYFKDEDVEMALARTEKWKRAPAKKLNLKSIKSVYSTWIPVRLSRKPKVGAYPSQWAFMVPYTAYVIGLGSYLYMNLWLRSTTEFNTPTLINVIPTGGYGLSIFMSLVYSWTSDAIRMRWPILLFGAIPPLTGNIIVSNLVETFPTAC